MYKYKLKELYPDATTFFFLKHAIIISTEFSAKFSAKTKKKTQKYRPHNNLFYIKKMRD